MKRAAVLLLLPLAACSLSTPAAVPPSPLPSTAVLAPSWPQSASSTPPARSASSPPVSRSMTLNQRGVDERDTSG